MSRSLLLIVLFAFIGLPVQSIANEKIRYYNIEVVVFENLQEGHFQTEHWAQSIERTIPEVFIDLNSPLPEQIELPDNTDPKLAFKEIPGKDLKLLEEASKIDQSRSRRVILHTAWVQPGLSHDKSLHVHFNQVLTPSITEESETADSNLALQPHEQKYQSASLDSLIRVSLARYLHVETDLLLTINSEESPNFVDSPFEQTAALMENVTDSAFESEQGMEAETDLRPLPRQVHIQQIRRRIRSNELHYLDHPLFGMLISISPHETNDIANKKK